MIQETAETRAKLANAIRDLQAKGDQNAITSLVSAYKAKYQDVSLKLDTPLREGVDKIAKAGTQAVQEAGSHLYDTYAAVPGKVGEDITAGAEDMAKGKPIKGALKAGGRTAADIAGAIYAPIGAGISAVTGTFRKLFPQAGDAYDKLIAAAGNNPLTDIPEVQKFAMNHPNAAEDFGRILTLITASQDKGTIDPARMAKEAAALPETIGNFTGKVAQDISAKAQELTTKTEDQLNSDIVSKFNKGVKPSVAGKNTNAQLDRYNEKVVDGVKTIKENQPNLEFNDTNGEVIKGEAPKTLAEFADAIEQTKKTIFKKYDALAKQAGDAGVGVDTAPIADELNTVINDKALQLSNPKAVAYAKEVQSRYSDVGNIDAQTAQDIVQHYNKALEAFYKNPTYDNASVAAIDSMVANRIRTSLDEGITGLTGEEYADLKSQYGSLKAIEKDVVKAAMRDARVNVKGLIDFSDIFSGAQVIHGIASLNPATLGSGLAAKAIATFYKYLNNPNRAVDGIFKAADKLPTGAAPAEDAPAEPLHVYGNPADFEGAKGIVNDKTAAIENATKEIASSGHDYDAAIKSGDVPKEAVYRPDGTLQKPVADHVIADIAGKLDAHLGQGLGTAFKNSLATGVKWTVDALIKAGQDFARKQ